jgi:peptide/nickel transport system substrate-binding protein
MMINRTTRLRLRRHFRRSKRHVGDIGEQAEEQLERHFLRRLSRLNDVRRFVLSWVGLLVLLAGIVVVQTRALSSYYQEQRPIPGGIYTEGIVGSFTNANPLYATGGVDKTVSQLVFASLLKFDEQGELVGDLAEAWSIDETGRRYTVRLRGNLVWHDGRPLTSKDVVFTYHRIQNPDAKSPLFSSWQGVKVEAPDARTVIFSLPNVLTSFPFSLTNGIVPEHLLKSIEPGQLRSARFNTAEPVGAGPFRWETVEVHGTTPEDREERVGLAPNDQYHGGAPKIQRFIIRSFRSEDRLLKSFENQELTAMVGIDSIPDSFEGDLKVKPYSIPVSGAVMVFFNNSHDYLKDPKIRQALVKAVDTKQLVNDLGYPAIPVNSPFLKSHLSYDSALTQFGTNIDEANKLLDEAGWKRGQNGIRIKDNQPLSFRLSAQNNSEFTYVGQTLQRQWRAVGVAVEVDQPSDNEFQPIVAFHNYDALLYGISLGADPDVFAYWHSSQADPRSPNRLNFSEYNSQQADQSLEGGRTRTDPQLRAVKYRPFLEAWRNDAPALALYQPRFLYIIRGGLYNFDPEVVHSAADRLSNVHNWMIRHGKTNR